MLAAQAAEQADAGDIEVSDLAVDVASTIESAGDVDEVEVIGVDDADAADEAAADAADEA